MAHLVESTQFTLFQAGIGAVVRPGFIGEAISTLALHQLLYWELVYCFL